MSQVMQTTTYSTTCGNCGHLLTRPDIQLPTSPVPQLLGGNRVITPSQAQIVHSTISATLSDISQLDREINRTQMILDELRRKRADLQSYTDAHKVLVAPIRQLPFEVLSEIFLQLIEIQRPDDQPLCRSSHLDKTPLLAGSICTQWRGIALATPRLWTSISLVLQQKYLRSDVALMKLWLSRTRAFPLTICLASDGDFQSNMRSLMDVFVSQCERWQNVRLSLPDGILSCLSRAKRRLAMLRWLSIDGLRWTSTMDTFTCAPLLHRLILTRADIHSIGRSFMQFPVLRSIEVTFDDRPASLLDALQLPTLQEMTISSVSTPWTRTIQYHLISLFSQCTLEKFTFGTWGIKSDFYPSDKEMMQILQATPELTELNIWGSSSRCMSEAFLAQFTRRGSDVSHLVPRLQSISLDYKPSDFDIMGFADAIESRILMDEPGDRTLKKVTIDYSPVRAISLRAAVVTRLRELRDLGLDICVYYKYDPSGELDLLD